MASANPTPARAVRTANGIQGPAAPLRRHFPPSLESLHVMHFRRTCSPLSQAGAAVRGRRRQQNGTPHCRASSRCLALVNLRCGWPAALGAQFLAGTYRRRLPARVRGTDWMVDARMASLTAASGRLILRTVLVQRSAVAARRAHAETALGLQRRLPVNKPATKLVAMTPTAVDASAARAAPPLTRRPARRSARNGPRVACFPWTG